MVPPLGANIANPFVNSLGTKFVPVPIEGGPTGGANVLFSVWDTRVQDYAAFAQETGRMVERPAFEQQPTEPVVMVSWDDAVAFCDWLNQKEGRTYRLPSDHEWSCAVGIGGQEQADQTPEAKDGKVAGYPWGPAFPPPMDFGNYGASLKVDRFEHTSQAGRFAPNRFGLCDLSGNVWQWCRDWDDPQENEDRVLRGSPWCGDDEFRLRSSCRIHSPPEYSLYLIGFRAVLVLSGG